MNGLGQGETFTERFNRLTAHMTDGQLLDLLGLTMTALKKIQDGTTKTLKLRGGLRLARHLGVSPWELLGELPDKLIEHEQRIEVVEEHVAPADATAQRLATIEATLMQLTSTAFPRYPGLVSTLPSPGRIEQVEVLAKGTAERAASLADLVAEIGGRLRALEATAHQHGKRSASGPTGRS